MTGQELIDFIQSNKAEDAEIVIHDSEYALWQFPELKDVSVSRMVIRVNLHPMTHTQLNEPGVPLAGNRKKY